MDRLVLILLLSHLTFIVYTSGSRIPLSTEHHGCPPDQQWFCDLIDLILKNVTDCDGGSDEQGCEKRQCPPGYQKCADQRQCVEKKYFCDGGTEDCGDMSDEDGCDCDVIHRGHNGTFNSPHYPGNYSNNLNCKMTFEVPKGYNVELTFTDFDIGNASNCSFDNVTIPATLGSTGGTYCGATLPNTVMSKTNELILYLRTNNAVTRRGFSGTFRAFYGGPQPVPCPDWRPDCAPEAKRSCHPRQAPHPLGVCGDALYEALTKICVRFGYDRCPGRQKREEVFSLVCECCYNVCTVGHIVQYCWGNRNC